MDPESTSVVRKQQGVSGGAVAVGGTPSPAVREVRRGGGGPGVLTAYKPEQGKWTRWGTFVGTAALIVWGAVFLNQRLAVYEGDEAWRLLITPGIPIVIAVALGAVVWWLCWGQRAAGDFMIATEGEMKKVSWSSRREIIGSTKVVILFTILMAVFLFLVDLAFQAFFSWIGVLKA